MKTQPKPTYSVETSIDERSLIKNDNFYFFCELFSGGDSIKEFELEIKASGTIQEGSRGSRTEPEEPAHVEDLQIEIELNGVKLDFPIDNIKDEYIISIGDEIIEQATKDYYDQREDYELRHQ